MTQEAPHNLGQRTARSVLWAGFGQVGSQGIHYLVLLTLACLLQPADFGLVGLAMIVILFSLGVAEGLGPAIVQREDLSAAYLGTAFWTNLTLSLLMAAVTVLLAPWLAAFLGDMAVQPLMRVLSIVFPLAGLSVVPRAILMRRLDFRRLALQQFLSELSFGAVGVTMAWSGFGVWSLAGAVLAQRIVATVVLWVMARQLPGWIFDRECFRHLIGFGLPVMGTALLNKGVQNIDYFIVGRWLGSEALGYYTLAFQLAVLPGQRVMGTVRNVAFPSFVLVRTDVDRLRQAFLEGVRHLFAALGPLALLTAVLAPWFIQWIYGDKWLPAVQPLQVLALASLFYGFDIAQALFFAVGRPGVRLAFLGLRISFFLSFVFLFGLQLGIVGVAASMTAAVGITAFLAFLLSSRLAETTVGSLLKPLWPAARAVVLACLPLLGAYFLPLESASPFWVLVGLGMAMGLIMLLALAPTYRSLWGRLVLRGRKSRP